MSYKPLEPKWNERFPIVDYSVGWIYIYPKIVCSEIDLELTSYRERSLFLRCASKTSVYSTRLMRSPDRFTNQENLAQTLFAVV